VLVFHPRSLLRTNWGQTPNCRMAGRCSAPRQLGVCPHLSDLSAWARAALDEGLRRSRVCARGLIDGSERLDRRAA
jgi:hypothetical protein